MKNGATVLLFAMFLLPARAQVLPDTPQPQPERTCHFWCTMNPVTHKYDRPMLTNAEAFNWSFTTSSVAFFGATALDVEITKAGLRRGKCVEKNGDPYPSRGQLYGRAAIEDGVVWTMAYLLRRAHVKYFPEAALMYGVAVHGKGAYDWATDGCF
jgi:hypothetical protein